MTGIKAASASISSTVSDLGAGLSQSSRTLAAEVAERLTAAGAEFRSATQRSNEESFEMMAGVLREATEARTTMASDLMQLRKRLLSDAAEEKGAAARRLQATAAVVASALEGFGRNLPKGSEDLPRTLRVLSEEMCHLKVAIDEQRVREGELAALIVEGAGDRLGAVRRATTALAGHDVPRAAAGMGALEPGVEALQASLERLAAPGTIDYRTLAAGVDRFVSAKRAP